MNFARIVFAAAFAVTAFALAGPACPADANMQILMDKIKADKKLVVAHNMQLSDAESQKFWPLYDSYQKELESINTRMLKLINDYAGAYNKNAVNEAFAKKLVPEALAIEQAEVDLRKIYADRVSKAVSAVAAARYLQIEGKIRAMVRYELAANIPLVP